jgi:hypothetical protein
VSFVENPPKKFGGTFIPKIVHPRHGLMPEFHSSEDFREISASLLDSRTASAKVAAIGSTAILRQAFRTSTHQEGT